MRKVCVPTILTRYHDDLAIGAVSEGCTLSSLEAKVQPIQVSPCQAGLAGQRLSVSTRFLLSQHALVPFGFRRQVGWVTQKSSLPNFSFLQKGSINGLSGAHHQHIGQSLVSLLWACMLLLVLFPSHEVHYLLITEKRLHPAVYRLLFLQTLRYL